MKPGSSPSSKGFDVAVVGRGAVGSVAALAFARAGRRVALVAPGALPDRAVRVAAAAPHEPSDWDTRVFALSPASRSLLLELGVWQLMDASRIAPVHDMRLYNDAPGLLPRQRPEVHLDAYRGRIEALAWIVENRELQGAIDRAIAWSLPGGALTRVDAAVDDLVLPDPDDDRPSDAVLGLAGGGRLAAGLVIAADGTASPLRLMSGIEHELRDYDQTAIVANFESSRPHRDCAWQWFGREGVVALLPLPSEDLPHGQGRVSLVWSAPTERAAPFLADAGEADLGREVEALSHGELGSLRRITPPAGFPLRSVHCRRVIAPSFVLIGDAAHAVHPMAGQGMNLGFGDVRGLMDALLTEPARSERARRPDWLLLRRYERARREPVAAMQLALGGLHQAFGDLPVPFVGLRDLGWEIVARSSWIRRRMIAHAVS